MFVKSVVPMFTFAAGRFAWLSAIVVELPCAVTVFFTAAGAAVAFIPDLPLVAPPVGAFFTGAGFAAAGVGFGAGYPTGLVAAMVLALF